MSIRSGCSILPVDPFAVSALDEIGIDLSGHQPKSFDQLEDDFFDLVVSLSPEAQHRAVEMTRTSSCEIEFWPTMDPSATTGNREMRHGCLSGSCAISCWSASKTRFGASAGGPVMV